MKKKTIRMTENHGAFTLAGEFYKAHHYDGTTIVFEKIDRADWERRIDQLASAIIAQPDVDLVSVLKDALYDLPLKKLQRVESVLGLELQKEKPKVRTVPRGQGTCVNLAIGGRFAMPIRE